MRSFLILIPSLIVLEFVSSATNDDIDCLYEGNMCKIDVEDCLRKKLHDGGMTDCTGISYQDLFLSRDDVDFWIDIYDRTDYAQNLTYTIVSEIGDIWKSVDGCCEMKPTSTCILPKRKKEEIFFIYLPLKKSGEYCELRIFEYQKELKWCNESVKTPCKELVRGILTIKGIYQPLSTDNFHPPVDFCFFHVPADLVKTRNGQHEEYTHDVKGITHNIQTDNSVLVGTTQKRCDLVENIAGKNITQHISSRYKRSADETVCFFTKLKGYDNKWSRIPLCRNPCTADSNCFVGRRNSGVMWKSIVIVLTISTFLLVIFVMSWKYRENITTCMPSMEASIKELPDSFVARNKDDCVFIDDAHADNIFVQKESIKEISKKKKSTSDFEEKEYQTDRYISSLTNGQLRNSYIEKVDIITKPNKHNDEDHIKLDRKNNNDIADTPDNSDVTWKRQDSGFERDDVISCSCNQRTMSEETNTDSGFSELSKRSSTNSETFPQIELECAGSENKKANFTLLNNKDRRDFNEISIGTRHSNLNDVYLEKSSLLTINDIGNLAECSEFISRRKRISSSSSGCVSADSENRFSEVSMDETSPNVVESFNLSDISQHHTSIVNVIQPISRQPCTISGYYVEK